MLSPKDFRPAQPKGIDFVYQGDQSLLLADVGTGKSVMLLTAMQQWVDDAILKRALVLAPKRVCMETWLPELDEWSHLDPDKLRMGCIAGKTPTQRVKLIEDTHYNVLLANYELLPWLMEAYPDGLPDCNVLICDEIDKLKDPTTRRFKGQPRRRDQKYIPGMKDWRENFQLHHGATGTPLPNHLLDLWAQVYVIDGGERLGDNYYEYRQRHFYQSDWAGFKYEILPGREAWIYNQIEDITFRIASIPGTDTPELVELPVRWVTMDKKHTKQYKELERNYIVELSRMLTNKVEFSTAVENMSGTNTIIPDEGAAVVEAENAGVLYGKLKQMAQGFAYVENPNDPEDRAYPMLLSHAKLLELESLVSELQGQPLMVVYHFKAQLLALQKRFGKRFRYLGGGQSDASVRETIKDWNDNKIPIMGVQPQSAGHGLNLQKGGAHHIALITLPESAGLYQQVIGRLARGGNVAGTVYVHRILTRGTVDEDRNAIVHGKIENQKELLAAMELRNS